MKWVYAGSRWTLNSEISALRHRDASDTSWCDKESDISDCLPLTSRVFLACTSRRIHTAYKMASTRSLMVLTSSFSRLAVRPTAPIASYASPIASTSRLTLQSTFRPFSSTPSQSATMRQGQSFNRRSESLLTDSNQRMPSEASWSYISQTPSPITTTRSRSST